jgi:peptidoglycan/LPS O-acetylase OafA/YrhL
MINAQYRIQDFFTFVYKRALRIEPPYLISLLIAAAYLNLRNYIPGSASVDLAPGWDELLMHIGYLVPFFEDARWINPVYWSLSVEFQYYILLGLLFPLAMHSMVWLRILFYALLLIGPFVSYQSSFFTSWSSLFLLGILYILQYLKKINRVEFWIFLLAASSITYWKVGPNDLLVGLLALLVIHFFRNFDFKIGRYFGDRSFSIYLLHSITGAPIINFLSHRCQEAWQKPMVIVFGFFICLICSHYFHRWVEMPSLRLSKKINYTRGS